MITQDITTDRQLIWDLIGQTKIAADQHQNPHWVRCYRDLEQALTNLDAFARANELLSEPRSGLNAETEFESSMSVRTKLLEAVGNIDIHDVGEEALIEILVNKIKAQDKRIQELCSENAREYQRLHYETEAMRIDRAQMRRDPLYGAYGEFYFLGRDGGRFCLSMQSGKIARLYERFKKNDWMMQQVTHEQWAIMEGESELKKKRERI